MFNKALGLILLLVCPLMAQETDWATQMRKFDALRQRTGSSRDYRLGPGDLIEVTVFGVESLSRELRVSASGNIGFPFLGKILVDGITGEELENRLTDLISEQKLVRDPQVAVFVKEYRSRPVYVLGAVNQPGQYMMSQRLTLLDALTMAGGLDQKRAADYLLIQRGAGLAATADDREQAAEDGDKQARVTKIDLKGLLEDGQLTLNIPIEGGDVIQVPEKKVEIFYVVGEVGRAGAFEFPSDTDNPLRLSQALSWAGGPARTAKMSDGILVRYEEDGRRQELPVDFKAILQGRQPDLPVRPNDIIFVPGSTFKTLGYGLLGVVPGTVSGAIILRP